MITKFEKFNEGINHLLVGPTEEEIWNHYMEGDLKGLITSIPETHEDFFVQMRENCVLMGEDNNGYIYGKRGIELFQENLKYGFICISYKYIWSIFENIYNFNKQEIYTLINKQCKNDEEWKDLTPTNSEFTYCSIK